MPGMRSTNQRTESETQHQVRQPKSPLPPANTETTFKQVSTGGEGQGEGELRKPSSFF